MFCENCGSQIADGSAICPNCGAAVRVSPTTGEAVPVQPIEAVPVQPVYQQPVQAAPQAAPALAKVKGGPRQACFVVGLITCILLILETFPVFGLGAMMVVFGPITMMLFGADTGDLFGTGLLVCAGGFILMDAAIVSIVFNGICTKITAKRPASKCRSLRMAAAVMTFVDSAIVLAPVIGLNTMMSGAEFLYGVVAVTFIMATVFLILAIITNSKEKKLASA